MSATRNTDAVTGQGGEFSSKVPRSEPLTTKGHQVGRKVSPADHASEFHAQTLPAGTAPADRTFQPNNDPDFSTEASGSDGLDTGTSASEALGGATSGDVHTGLGKPIQGMSSAEQKHDGKAHRERDRSGLETLGNTSSTSKDQRELGGDNNAKSAQEKGLAAEERIPTSADELAAEFD